jgi:hypothetical protein
VEVFIQSNFTSNVVHGFHPIESSIHSCAGGRAGGLRGCAVSTSGDDEEEALRGCSAPVKRNGDLAACNLATDDARGQCIAVQFAVTIHHGFGLGKKEQPIGTASERATHVGGDGGEEVW